MRKNCFSKAYLTLLDACLQYFLTSSSSVRDSGQAQVTVSLAGFLGSFRQHVELSQASTQSQFNGQHKAGLLPLSHGTHAHVPLGHMDEVDNNKCKA